MPEAKPSAATLHRAEPGEACPIPPHPVPAGCPPPSWALLVQGDVSVRLRRAWPLGAGLPEPTLPRPRRGPGTAAVLRVPPLQGLPRVQAERDWDDRQQADVPGAGQRAASAEMPSEGTPPSCCCPSPPLCSSYGTQLNLPGSKNTLSGQSSQHGLGQQR